MVCVRCGQSRHSKWNGSVMECYYNGSRQQGSTQKGKGARPRMVPVRLGGTIAKEPIDCCCSCTLVKKDQALVNNLANISLSLSHMSMVKPTFI